MMTDLTIIIPAYKVERFLAPCVASALRCQGAQIIIADNHSPDQTLTIARAMEAANPDRIRVIARPENIGMTANWQRTMELATTPFVLNFSADDIISAAYVTTALNFMRQHPDVGIVAGSLREVNDQFGLDSQAPVEEPVFVEDFRMLVGLDAARFAFHWHPFPACPSTIFRKQAWSDAGGFDLQLNTCPDREIWFRIARQHAVALCSKMGVFYRVHSANETSSTWRKDTWCYEFSHMYQAARKVWPETELRPLFRRAFLVNSKAFFGSVIRAAKRGDWGQMPGRFLRGFADLWHAL